MGEMTRAMEEVSRSGKEEARRRAVFALWAHGLAGRAPLCYAGKRLHRRVPE
ncbi:MAG TPA: hypothetical protein PLM79_15005 [Syntrophobacteraceae bacterium]|nr:hypothetical protein [Syntrophobacteraceae bacterium]